MREGVYHTQLREGWSLEYTKNSFVHSLDDSTISNLNFLILIIVLGLCKWVTNVLVRKMHTEDLKEKQHKVCNLFLYSRETERKDRDINQMWPSVNS